MGKFGRGQKLQAAGLAAGWRTRSDTAVSTLSGPRRSSSCEELAAVGANHGRARGRDPFPRQLSATTTLKVCLAAAAAAPPTDYTGPSP